MRRAGLLVLLCCAVASAAVRAKDDVPAPRPALVTVDVRPRTSFVGQVVEVELRVGYDPAFFREAGVRLFPRRVDVPILVTAPWLEALPGMRRIPPPASAPDVRRREIALNDAVVRLEDTPAPADQPDGWRVLTQRARYVPERSGLIVLTAPTVRFAWATSFEEHFLRGRVPLDRRDEEVTGPRTEIEVHPLPEAGRPAGFSGAVGQYSVQARAWPAQADPRGAFPLRLEIRGEGDLEALSPPRLDDLEGFHVYGMREEVVEGGRAYVYDVARVDPGTAEIPPIRFPYFDPAPPGAWHVAKTRALSLGAAAPAAEGPGTNVEEAPLPAKPSGSRSGALLAILAALLALALGAALLLRRRVRAAQDVSPELRRARAARAELGASLRTPGTDPADAFSAYLAAHLACPPAAVISPRLSERLEAAGLSQALARRAAEALESTIAARYGAGAATTSDLEALADEIEAVLAPRAPGCRDQGAR